MLSVVIIIEIASIRGHLLGYVSPDWCGASKIWWWILG